MKKLILLAALFAAVALSACKYDDDDIWKSVHGLENRVAALEELCKQMNTNISSLQTIVTALQNNDYVTGVIPVVKNGETIGYTISFTKSAPITIYHGENGKDGERGSDGKDGHTPVIGVRQGSDGIYYWTLDGEWLLDNSGNKIKAEGRDGADGKDGENGKDGTNGNDGQDGKDGENGKDGQNGADGKDGITPQLKIEDGYWYVSTDNGATWTNLGKATGEDGKDGADGKDGDSMFQSVTQDENNVYFTLASGETIVLPKKQQLAIIFAEGNEFSFNIGQTVTVNYTIVGGGKNIVKAEMQNLDGGYTLRTTQTNATEGTIAIRANVPTENNVIVSVSNGSHTVMEAIAVTNLNFDDNPLIVETPGTLAQLIADYDKNAITKLVIAGNLNSADFSTLNAFPNLAVLNIENVNLEELPDNPFQNKKSLTDIKLPRTLKYIGDFAFQDCTGLTSITIPDGVTSIGISAFGICFHNFVGLGF